MMAHPRAMDDWAAYLAAMDRKKKPRRGLVLVARWVVGITAFGPFLWGVFHG